jgi:hypothetical protein
MPASSLAVVASYRLPMAGKRPERWSSNSMRGIFSNDSGGSRPHANASVSVRAAAPREPDMRAPELSA